MEKKAGEKESLRFAEKEQQVKHLGWGRSRVRSEILARAHLLTRKSCRLEIRLGRRAEAFSALETLVTVN